MRLFRKAADFAAIEEAPATCSRGRGTALTRVRHDFRPLCAQEKWEINKKYNPCDSFRQEW